MHEIEDKNVEVFAVLDSANTSELFKNLKTVKIKRSECPYGGIDCAWCTEECE